MKQPLRSIGRPADPAETITRAGRFLRGREDVLFAYLFGSLATGRAHGLSDVDVAVYLDAADIPASRMAILGGLQDALRLEAVDLVVLNTAPLPLTVRVLRSRRLLADRAPLVHHAFESATIRSYLDFAKLEARILERRYLHG
jgi:hypothetical protein